MLGGIVRTLGLVLALLMTVFGLQIALRPDQFIGEAMGSTELSSMSASEQAFVLWLVYYWGVYNTMAGVALLGCLSAGDVPSRAIAYVALMAYGAVHGLYYADRLLARKAQAGQVSHDVVQMEYIAHSACATVGLAGFLLDRRSKLKLQ